SPLGCPGGGTPLSALGAKRGPACHTARGGPSAPHPSRAREERKFEGTRHRYPQVVAANEHPRGLSTFGGVSAGRSRGRCLLGGELGRAGDDRLPAPRWRAISAWDVAIRMAGPEEVMVIGVKVAVGLTVPV